MITFAYESHLTPREEAILTDLLRFRVMTTDMIEKRHFERKGNYVNVLLSKLRKDGYIRSKTLRRSRIGKKGISYHQLTETGRECLIRHDVSVEGQSKHLYLSEHQIPNLLLANEALLEYDTMGWQVYDSRYVKAKYRLDYRDNIQGLIVSPQGEEYGLYTLETNVTDNVIGRIQSEITKNQGIKNYIILAKGDKSYKSFLEYGYQEEKEKLKSRLLTTGKLIIEPFTVNFMKKKAIPNEIDWIKGICRYYNYKIKSIELKNYKKRQSFPIIVEYKGKEYYLVDLTDSDLNKYNDIEVYINSKSSRNWEKRDVLAVTLSISTKPNQVITNLHGVTNQIMTIMDLQSICSWGIE